MRSTRLAGLVPLGLAIGVACSSATAPPVIAPTASSTSTPLASAITTASSTPTPPSSASAPAVAAQPKLCGCALCEPLLSDDTCGKDADCAPSIPCHAPACVAKANAVARKPDEACTSMMVCASVDANSCLCYRGHCALLPKRQGNP